MIKHRCWDAGVVGHRVLLHVLEGRELHNLADDLIRDRHVQVPHDALHFTPRILGGGNTIAGVCTTCFGNTGSPCSWKVHWF